MKSLRRRLLHNAGLKLLALLIAFLMWAVYTAEPRVEVGYDVPLEFVRIDDKLQVAPGVPARIHVRLRGRSAVLRQLTPADMAVRVDLAGQGAGETLHTLGVGRMDLPPGVECVSIYPTELRVTLIPRQSPQS